MRCLVLFTCCIALISCFTLLNIPGVMAESLELGGYTGEKFEPAVGSYLGGYIYQDSNVDSKQEFHDKVGEQHASYFKYHGYGQPFPRKWVQEVKEAGGAPQIAFEPNQGLEAVQDDEYLRDFARAANEADVPIFLRFASEMNGNWQAYSGDADLYIEKWKLVHEVMEEEAPNVAMV